MPDESSKSRREFYDDAEVSIEEMPQCNAFYVLEYLFEIGVTLADNPITHGELRAWMDNTGINLQPWESCFMKKLSMAYLSACHESKKPDTPAPFNAEYFDSANRYIKSMKSKNSIKKMVEEE